MLCLDLSESMNERSGVSRPTATHGAHDENVFDHERASFDLLEDLAKLVSEDVILENGENHFTVRQRT